MLLFYHNIQYTIYNIYRALIPNGPKAIFTIPQNLSFEMISIINNV